MSEVHIIRVPRFLFIYNIFIYLYPYIYIHIEYGLIKDAESLVFLYSFYACLLPTLN